MYFIVLDGFDGFLPPACTGWNLCPESIQEKYRRVFKQAWSSTTTTATMGKKRVLVGYGIDVDAVSNHINSMVGGKPNLMNISRGLFHSYIFHTDLILSVSC